MSRFIESSLSDYLKASRSAEPTPGGGSVSALVAGLGAALGQMVMSLSVDKEFFQAYPAEQRAVLEEANASLFRIEKRLAQLVDEDGEAFAAYMDALRLPKNSEEEKTRRRAAMAKAMRGAMETPLETASLCVEILEALPEICAAGNANAITDAGVAVLLAEAACHGSLYNVRINLNYIKDEALVSQTKEKVAELTRRSTELKEAMLKVVDARL